MSKQEIGEVFAKSNDSLIATASALENYIQPTGKHSLTAIFAPEWTQGDSYKGMKIYTSIDSLRASIAYGVSENGISSAVVLLNPPLGDGIPRPMVVDTVNLIRKYLREIQRLDSLLASIRKGVGAGKPRISAPKAGQVADSLSKVRNELVIIWKLGGQKYEFSKYIQRQLTQAEINKLREIVEKTK